MKNWIAGERLKSADLNGALNGLADGTAFEPNAVMPSVWTNPYCFHAYDSGGTSMVDAVDTKIAYATEVYDYNNNFATGTYTAPVNGVYNFGAYFLLGTVATLVTLYCAIYVNGATYKRGIRLDTTFGNNNGACVVADIPLNAGDTVEFYGYQNSAGNEACNADAKYTYCFGHLIHAT